MNLDDFRALLDAHGSRSSSWPNEHREHASALLTTSEEARALLVEATNLESALALVPHYEPSAALRRRVAEIPLTSQRRRHLPTAWTWWPFKTVFVPAMAMTAAALMGVLAGTAVFEPVAEDELLTSAPASSLPLASATTGSATASVASDELSDAEVEDYFELAFATHLDHDPWQ